MTKNCEFCGRKFPDTNPRRRFCGPRCNKAAWLRRNPNHGVHRESMSHYWLTAKAYRAIGKKPPRAVMATDHELGILG